MENFRLFWIKIQEYSGWLFTGPELLLLDAGLAVTVSRQCLLLIQSVNKGSGYKITVADPTTKTQNIIIKISKKLKGAGVTVNPDESTSISITVPSGENAGKSIMMEFSNEKASSSCGIENFKPGPLPFFY
jgi:hypothetical protein